MIIETIHQETGAILFKKDKESLKLDYLEDKILELENRIKSLEAKLQEESS